ncbi:hypothetical protein ACFOY8_14820 [Thalassospira xianhensis]|uniref:hypothetical protein n=1 Tax=Thalassospira xianhensis TaxID=478503 RepID=UPI000DEDDD58|nr:hypothetical protein [Thalassospira xianhensis]
MNSANFEGLYVASRKGLLNRVRSDAGYPGSSLHGEQHWRCVASAANFIAEYTPNCDLATLSLFSLLHDSMREDDGYDEFHGQRAAEYLDTLVDDGVIGGGEADISRLRLAIYWHNQASVDPKDSTIGACWDADRLNLWRLGIRPNARYLSTEFAQRENTINQAMIFLNSPPEWEEILSCIPEHPKTAISEPQRQPSRVQKILSLFR